MLLASYLMKNPDDRNSRVCFPWVVLMDRRSHLGIKIPQPHG
ncbi:hypothetical protein PMH09_18930 [Roseofilum sp. BLCC_M143]|uniref:Uncharacterized protein n=1 Tax=Roseofilum casamattae BLCC-M143 TaxID=3022442 RepID=A0ABT7C1D3_9CYAN|nr:hypothetical protein [Roseofilum casamattae BLCC-M143]